MTMYLTTTSSILSSLPISNIILLKLLFSPFINIIKAMSHQTVTCFTSLDWSTAFDTLDHYILLQRLSSWFGSFSTVLFGIRSYLLNPFFYVNIDNSKWSAFQLLYEVPQGSVLGPLLFILQTIPLITVTCNSAANDHLYADDTKLLLPLSALDCPHHITHIETL